MKLLVFDDHYVAARPNIERRYFRPEKLGEFHDGTEQLQLYTSYFYDPTVGKYRLYYEAPIPGLGTEARILKLYEADSAEALLGGQAEYLLIFREVTQSDTAEIAVDAEGNCRVLASNAACTAALQEGKLRITLDKPRAYALIQLQ